MNSVEDQVRAATRAHASTMRGVPPLRLPPGVAPRPGSAGQARRWRSWLAPVGAAAAVLALAIALVIIKGSSNGPVVPPTAPASSSSAVPAYYVALASKTGWYGYASAGNHTSVPPSPPNELIVRDTFTGEKAATITPPSGTTFMGVSGTADDRTFVVDLASFPPSSAGNNLLANRTASRSWELLKISPGGSPGYRLTALPIPATAPGTDVRGFTLSPDGGKLAVVLQPGASGNSEAPVLLRLYSIATGAVLRTWTTTDGDDVFGGSGYTGPDANHLVAWVSGTRLLAFGREQPQEVSASNVVLAQQSAHIMLLDTARPGSDLLTDSRPAVRLNPPSLTEPALRCGLDTLDDVLISGNGTFLACSEEEVTRPPAAKNGDCATETARSQVAFADAVLATGALVKTIASYPVRCYGPQISVKPLWVNYSGGAMIGYLNLDESGPRATSPAAGSRFGLFSNGRFTPLPLPPAFAAEGAAAFAW